MVGNGFNLKSKRKKGAEETVKLLKQTLKAGHSVILLMTISMIVHVKVTNQLDWREGRGQRGL